MQTVSGQFTGLTQAKLRQLYWLCYISFRKNLNDSIAFFTIGTSTIGGIDIIRGDGNVIQEWDKYDYVNYGHRILDFEYTREQDPYIGGAILSMADLTLDNHDDYFTPGHPNSPIGSYILPWRPVKLFAGFQGQAIPVFVGLIEKMPDVDDRSKTVKIHCIDFMQALFNYPLDEAVMLEDYTTDQIISTLLQLAGLSASQFSLDSGLAVIPFFYAEKGSKLGDSLRDLAEAEMGRIYMDETGTIRFINRTNWLNNTTDVWTFNRANTIEKRTTKDDNIINVVEVTAQAREVQANQKYWQLVTPVLIPHGQSVDIWADFTDPVTGVDDPDYISGATTSLYETNESAAGTGDTLDGSITLSATQEFSKSFKMTFANSNPDTDIYITNIELFATPARATKDIYERVQDDTSVTNYHERPLSIDNDYIQDDSTAASLATMIIEDNKNFNPVRELDVVGVPQLQVGDLVRVTDDKTSSRYYVTKIVGKMIQTQFAQTITVVNKTIRTYFRIGISTIGGGDVISP